MITIPQRHRRTDVQTDGRTTCRGNTALRVASRGNKSKQVNIFNHLVDIGLTVRKFSYQYILSVKIHYKCKYITENNLIFSLMILSVKNIMIFLKKISWYFWKYHDILNIMIFSLENIRYILWYISLIYIIDIFGEPWVSQLADADSVWLYQQKKALIC